MKPLAIRFSINLKLVLLISLFLMAATVPFAVQSTRIFRETSERRESDSNLDFASARATEIENLLHGYATKIRMIGSLMVKPYANPEDKKSLLDMAFFQDADLVSFEIWKLEAEGPKMVERLVRPEYFALYGLTPDHLETARRERPLPLGALFAGSPEVLNSSLAKGAPLLTVGLPFFKGPDDRILYVGVADFKLAKVQRVFEAASAFTSFLVDKSGRAIGHPKESLALTGADLSGNELVRRAFAAEEGVRRGQANFREEGESFIGAYAKNAYGLTVLSQAPEHIFLEPAMKVQREIFYIGGLVLSGALFLVFLFSISLTRPLEELVTVTGEIAKGNFDIRAKILTSDEVGALARSVNGMAEGLVERDRIRNLFNKFHGSSIAEDMIKRDVALGGTRKNVTVFFSDIRGFTKFSEGHTPEEVVDMLNEYFTIMVDIITRNHGVVDKFVGDAIMALWGAPQSTGFDQAHALKACLEMRQALAQLNQRRISRGQTPIRIGMGLHTGPAISGTIGSHQRMEYTAIGDTVNVSSRIEASTKVFGADLLVSEDVAAKTRMRFLLEAAGAVEVKGKSEPLKLYKVKGYIDEKGQPRFVETPYSESEPQHDEKVKIA